MDLVGFEPTTMVDQTKFDLKAITTRLRTPQVINTTNLRIVQWEPSFD